MILKRNKTFSDSKEKGEKGDKMGRAVSSSLGVGGLAAGGYLAGRANRKLKEDVDKAEWNRNYHNERAKHYGKKIQAGELSEIKFGLDPKSSKFKYKLSKDTLKKDLEDVAKRVEQYHGKDLEKALKKNSKRNLAAAGLVAAGGVMLGSSIKNKKKKDK